MMVCKCLKTLPLSIGVCLFGKTVILQLGFFLFGALWVPPHNANIVPPKNCFWERVGIPTRKATTWKKMVVFGSICGVE